MRILIIAIFAAVLVGIAVWPSVGVVYANDTKTVLRIILPDSNIELYEQPLSVGESMLVVLVLPFGDTCACAKQIDVYACRRVVEAAL